MEQEAVIN
ncbi:hypothetical protein ECFRIK1985_5725, partial [Escherichia coli FRIK1985]